MGQHLPGRSAGMPPSYRSDVPQDQRNWGFEQILPRMMQASDMQWSPAMHQQSKVAISCGQLKMEIHKAFT